MNPFGRRIEVSGDVDADFGFTGHFEHAATGLTFALYRAYDSNLGRWLSRDPIGLVGGLNLYAYVANDPINYVDPLGLSAETFAQGAAGAAVGAAVGAGALAAASGTAAAPAVAAALAIAGIWSASWGLGELIASGLYGDINEVDNRAGAMCVIGAAGLAGALKAQGIPRSVNDAIATGKVKAGGKLSEVLRGMEKGYERANPQNANEGMKVVAEAAEQANLEPGHLIETGPSGHTLKNAGGVLTTIDAAGNITVTRNGQSVLKLCRRR